MSECTLLYVHGESMGYGRLGVKLAASLKDQGHTVWDHHVQPPESVRQQGLQDATKGRTWPPCDERTKALCWVSVPGHAEGWWEGQTPTLFTMWEASRIPESFRESLHNFDRVLVPSTQNVELFSRYHDDVRRIPLGVDPAEWHLENRPLGDEAFFRFLIGGSGPRKGTDLAFTAFERVFGGWFSASEYTGPKNMPVPTLVMKNPKGESQFSAPWLSMNRGRLDAEAERALYRSCHVYLQPSRGEGFGLQPLQAMAQGMPTILTNAHGHADFAHLGIPIGWNWSPADYFIYGDAGEWWEPDMEELCEAMWDTYQNYDAHVTTAATSAQTIARDWTWDRCAEKFYAEMADLMDAPRFTSNQWHEVEIRRYLVITTRKWEAEVAGSFLTFEPGVEYWETGDVKRILYEAGLLDPACLAGDGLAMGSENDQGLVPHQIERLEKYRADHSYCPTCHRHRNTGRLKADDIYEELLEAAGDR